MSVDNLGLGLQVLYSATDCVDNILGRFTMILASLVQIKARIHSGVVFVAFIFSFVFK